VSLSVKHFSISFAFVTAIGVATSWLSGCAQSEAATPAATSTTTDDLLVVLNQSVQNIHTQVSNSSVDGTVAYKLNQIQASINGQGTGVNTGNNNDSLERHRDTTCFVPVQWLVTAKNKT